MHLVRVEFVLDLGTRERRLVSKEGDFIAENFGIATERDTASAQVVRNIQLF